MVDIMVREGGNFDRDQYFMAGGAGPSLVRCVEEWNGSSWSAHTTLITAIQNGSGAGNLSTGITFGGATPSVAATTQEFSCSNLVNPGIYCFVKNLAPGAPDTSGTSYSTGY